MDSSDNTGSVSMETEDDSEDIPVDLQSLCRMCANPCTDTALLITQDSNLATRLYHYLHIKVEEDDAFLPKRVCCSCNTSLDHWHHVHNTVQQSQLFYQRQIQLRHAELSGSTFNSARSDAIEFICGTCKQEFITLKRLHNHQLTCNKKSKAYKYNYLDNLQTISDIEASSTNPLLLVNKSKKYDNLLEINDNSSCESECKLEVPKPKQSFSKVSDIMMPAPAAKIVVTPLVDPLLTLDGYPCGKCHNSFVNLEQFTEHIKTQHTNVRELPCAICSCYFRNKLHLIQHVHEHLTNPDKQLAFTCDLCNLVFSSRKNLVAHFQNRHSTKKPLNLTENLNASEVFKCGTCKEDFQGITEFAKHFPIAHPRFYELACGVCEARFKILPNLLKHEKLHKQNPGKNISFECSYCEKVFSEQRNLTHHLLVKHKQTKDQIRQKPQAYTCGECKQGFPDFRNFKDHFTTSHPVFQQIPCGICGVKFRKLELLLDHERLHRQPQLTETKIYNCKFCDRRFYNTDKLQHHMQSLHSNLETSSENNDEFLPNIRAISCNYCPLHFDNMHSLNEHMLRDHSQSELSSETLDSESLSSLVERYKSLQQFNIDHSTLGALEHFSQNYIDPSSSQGTSNMNYQTRNNKKREFPEFIALSQSINNDYSCTECNISFESQTVFNQHRLQHVLNTCPVCNTYFTQKRLLNLHMRDVHPFYRAEGKTLPCPFCGKLFRAAQTLKAHVELHSSERNYVCEYCAKTYRSSSTLYKHRQCHTDKIRFQCDFCQRCFNFKAAMKKHIMLHLNYKPFKCNQCDKRFTGLGILKIHKTKAHEKGFPYRCIRCRKGFKDVRNWRRHMRFVCRVPQDEIPYIRHRQFIPNTFYVPNSKKY